MINLNKSYEYVKSYNTISEDVKFVSNSVNRLKVLKALYDRPQNMKDLSHATGLRYSSISSILHGLELKDMVYRKSNKYHLVNLIKLQMKNIIELCHITNLLNDIYSLIQNHDIDKIPMQSIEELHLLRDAKLLESDGVDVDKINVFIEDALAQAKSVRCILPIFHEGFNFRLNDLIFEGKFVEVNVSQSVYDVYNKNSHVRYLSSFKGKRNFLLIVTDEIMIFGLFRNNGIFDLNRLLISRNSDSLKWANNLFRYFKMKNK